MRVDRWIWAVRMVKSRTLAGQMCRGGKVFVNDQKVKPSHLVRLGDVVLVRYKDFEKQYIVRDFLDKRGSAEKVSVCFEDISPEQPKRDFVLNPGELHQGIRDKGSGRPTKKERRIRDQLFFE